MDVYAVCFCTRIFIIFANFDSSQETSILAVFSGFWRLLKRFFAIGGIHKTCLNSILVYIDSSMLFQLLNEVSDVSSIKPLGMVYEPSLFSGGYIFTGATSNWTMKHLAICMHSHPRFRIRKFPKYVCDIYSWCHFCMSDAMNVFFHVAMSVERLVPFLVFLCFLGYFSLTYILQLVRGGLRKGIALFVHPGRFY